MAIGFEHAKLSVNENAGSVSLCVMILQPSGARDLIEERTYRVAVATTNEGAGIVSFYLTIIAAFFNYMVVNYTSNPQ